MPRPTHAVLFDLDGTLTDPFVGITGTLQHAIREMGHLPPPADDLRRYIGPPIHKTFLAMFGDEVLATQALGHYRQRYGEVGKFENELIPGIVEALETAARQGQTMFVATSKLKSHAIDIIDHFGLTRFFGHVHGSEADGTRADKGELIRYILKTEGLDPARTVMIGDRLHDVVGAAKNGMPAIGVLWGFGDRAELEAAGAARVADQPAELSGMIAELVG
ncbi:HAD hydrolase-like protein [Mesorhizobium sp. VNQ89]|uniref:HAD hydrolase-like protein n=1 Tax=Mesorhizobium quangtriensis TaxID=3157709 RepID=UPI0032B8832E